MRFYLDEGHSHDIAVGARRQGVDITSLHEVGRDHWTDVQQQRQAGEEGRCVITRNRSDFARLAREFEAQGLPHAGVVLVPESLPGNHYGAIVAALVRFDQEHPDGVPPYSVWWLSPARS